MNMKQAKVGFIGAGSFVSGYHLLTARDSRNMHIQAIADINEETLRVQTAKFHPTYVTTDYQRLLKDPDIDLIIIGTKHDLHAKLIIEALDAGKWVFCEKPMAQDDAEARAVLEACRRNRGRLAIGFNRRFSPAYRELKRLIQSTPKPWFFYYRQMCPYINKADFYYNQAHILYEGSHILDLAHWLMDALPVRLNMTGSLENNCVQMEFEDGSQFMLLCGTLGSYSYWKEQLEFCAENHAINIADMVDMRVRGWPGEFDRLFPPYLNEKKEEVLKYGFDFYDCLRSELVYRNKEFIQKWNIPMEHVRRPATLPPPYDIDEYRKENPELQIFFPDKGWRQSLIHFADCLLNGSEPENASGVDGAVSTEIAMALLDSLQKRQRVIFHSQFLTIAP
ncbi:MAG: Gfo/Idh/MocA family oxidoreductase [Victivallales bacterium]|nr:Gfo/Idh/MocA family oxidoreductase [Victivallales bacterium]